MGLFSTVKKGAIGEEYVARYLRKKRFKIIEMNMRNKYSEIDIIAQNKEYIVFVEVKSRSVESDLRPVYSVDKRKQELIMRAAHKYMVGNKINRQPRFDVAEVFISKETAEPYKLNYIENAYTQGGDYAVF